MRSTRRAGDRVQWATAELVRDTGSVGTQFIHWIGLDALETNGSSPRMQRISNKAES